jgi:S-formylglutathione hydrolase FrmB
MICVFLIGGCNKDLQPRPDHPYVATGSLMQDVVFHSAALNRDMPYRVFLPAHVDEGKKLPVVYLLHGGNGSFRDWSNDSQVSQFAVDGLILVMPEGEFSYYMNSAEEPADRFEDYTFGDLINDAESRFPAARSRDKRALIGISMGGFAAIKIALTRPDLFSFVAALSPPIEITHRRFNVRRWGEWSRIRKIFGPWGSETRLSRDPLSLIKNTDPAKVPYIYLTVGQNEPLLGADHMFADRLESLHFRHEFETEPGGHDWNQWNRQIPGCFQILFSHIGLAVSDPGRNLVQNSDRSVN